MKKNSNTTGVNSTGGSGAGKGARGTASTTKGESAVAQKPAQLTHPELDFHNKMFLDGKNDKIKELSFINVKFYPNGLQDVTYAVANDDGVDHMLSTAEFNALLRKKALENAKKAALPAAVGFSNKLRKRCLVEVPGEVDVVRRAQAITPPKIAAKLLGLSQSSLAEKGLNDPRAMLEYWSKQSPEVKKQMTEYQAQVWPDSVMWQDRLNDMVDNQIAEATRVKLRQEAKAFNATAAYEEAIEGGKSGEKPDPPPRKGKGTPSTVAAEEAANSAEWEKLKAERRVVRRQRWAKELGEARAAAKTAGQSSPKNPHPPGDSEEETDDEEGEETGGVEL